MHIANVGIPIAGSFDASGRAVVEVIPTEEFQWLGADIVLNGEMSLAAFKEAFDLSENVMDDKAELVVSMSTIEAKEIAFRLAMRNALTSAKDSSNKLLKAYLEEEAQDEIATHLSSNGIPDAVEAEAVTGMNLTQFEEDCSAGALDLWTAMSTANASPSMNIIARQFPLRRYPAVFDSVLPAQVGDVITFRFNVGQTYSLTLGNAAETGAAANGAPASFATFTAADTTLAAGYGVSARAVDLVLTLA
jgi:hypothetical protein